jgi:hypothetical protein
LPLNARGDNAADMPAFAPTSVTKVSKHLRRLRRTAPLALTCCQVEEGGPTSLQVEVPLSALAAVLEPAVRAGVKIVDARGVDAA